MAISRLPEQEHSALNNRMIIYPCDRGPGTCGSVIVLLCLAGLACIAWATVTGPRQFDYVIWD